MKRVQLAGGTFDVESFLVGLVRELRVDLDNDSLRLHDGVKVGGFEILNRDQNNALYQPRSAELDGFTFGAQAKGILTRVGPGVYRTRRIVVDEEQLVITNPRGTLGDFTIGWAPEITSDHTFTGLITFTQPIAAEGGVVGNLVGNVTGNVLGNVTGNLTGDSTGNHTGPVFIPDGDRITGDDDSIDENMIHGLLISRGIPYGGIIMWSGAAADIPESWALCDGDNGTPDLTDRFVVGAGDTYAPLQVGGAATLTGTATIAAGGAHDHPLSVDGHVLTVAEMPAHTHWNGMCDDGPGMFNHGSRPAAPAADREPSAGKDSGTVEGLTEVTGASAAHTHTGSTTESGSHVHDITLDEVGSLPPYFALCFIMKIAADA
jgi:hypothetical protein